MDIEIIESVLKEILEEQKANLRVTQDLSAGIDKLVGKIEGIYQRIEQQKTTPQSADVKQMQSVVLTGIRQIQQTLEAQPKSTVRQLRFLLFPEHFAEQYYRIIFGRLLFWMMIFLLATYFFVLGKQSIQSWERVQEKNLEANHARKAFDYLYKHADKENKRKMIDAWQKNQYPN